MSKKKAIESIKWNYIGVFGSSVARIAVTIVLTRLLAPNDFGLLALGLSIIIFGNMFADFGLTSALIQKTPISNTDIRYVFTLQILFGLILTLSLYIAAPLIASVYEEEKVTNILRALSLVFFLKSLSLTSISLLRRELEFKKINIIHLSSYMLSYFSIGIPLALLSFGVWSLVAAQLSQALLQTIFTALIRRHPIKPVLIHKDRGQLLNFGGKSITNNIINWSIENANTFLIGYFLGIIALGYYNRIATLAKMPMDMVTRGFQSVLFSFYSKIQDKDEHIIPIYRATVSFISLIIFPVFFTLAVIPESVIGAMFGKTWATHANIMTPLAIAMCVHVLLAMAGPILWGHNKGEREIIAQLYSALIAIVLISYLSQYSLLYASFGVLISFIARLYFINTALFKFLNIGWRSFFASISRSALLGTIVASITYAGDKTIMMSTGSHIICFASDFVIATLTLSFFLYFWPKAFIDKNLVWLLENNKEMLPTIVKARIWKDLDRQ